MRTMQSAKFTPIALVFTTTSPSDGSGSGHVTISSRSQPPAFRMSTFRIDGTLLQLCFQRLPPRHQLGDVAFGLLEIPREALRLFGALRVERRIREGMLDRFDPCLGNGDAIEDAVVL